MARTGDNLPIGFRGPVTGWAALVPSAERRLVLPRDRARFADLDRSVEFDLIEVTAFTESMGRVEDTFRRFAEQLAPGGTLLCDIDNVQSARMLRVVLEGRPGAFDPAGSSEDPSQPLLLRRALHAAAAAGLLVRDVLAVPAGSDECPRGLAQSLFDSGMMPLQWLQGAPPSRYWLSCQKCSALAGSVLIAGGDATARAHTEAFVRRYLPPDWEVVTAAAETECGQWNRALAAAAGDVVWFLRAGMSPSQAAFERMSVRAAVGPVVAAHDGEPIASGDVAGMMMPRLDALLVGPLPEHYENTCVALEDHVMRIESGLPKAWPVDVELDVLQPEVERPERLAAETEHLMKAWAELGTCQGSASHSATEQACGTAGRSPDAPPAAPWAGRAPRISLCMIARDEERFLGTCLEHARDAFDELVLVDTGSTDRTVAIAESYGAKVVHEPWADDFSAPRNTALAHATGDWILVLDADEFLQGDACARIRELVEDPSALGYHMRFINDYGDGKTIGVMMVRLFRNLPGIAYQNVIHEQVTPSLQRIGGELGLTFYQCDVEVVHHGYSHEVMDARGKNERNERLFLKQRELQPDDIYSAYKYGDFLRRVPGRNDDARAELERCFDLILKSPPSTVRALPYAGEVAALCGLEAERAEDHDRARYFVDTGLRRFVPTPNLHYLAASLALADGEAEAAIEHYRRCMAYRGCVLVVPIQEGITSYVSLAGIAQAYLQRGDRVRSRRLLEQAIAIEPSYEVAHLALSRLYIEAGDLPSALQVLTDFLAEHPDSPGASQQTMLILQRLGQIDAARRMGQHTVRLLEARCLEREAAAVNDILAAL